MFMVYLLIHVIISWTMDPGPYSSPKAQSPNVNRTGGLVPSQNESGNLKLSIALGQKGPTIIQKGPFYLVCKDEKDLDPQESTMTGATNLMASKGLEHSYVKLTSKITILDTIMVVHIRCPLFQPKKWRTHYLRFFHNFLVSSTLLVAKIAVHSEVSLTNHLVNTWWSRSERLVNHFFSPI